jgi:hypothetical protein
VNDQKLARHGLCHCERNVAISYSIDCCARKQMSFLREIAASAVPPRNDIVRGGRSNVMQFGTNCCTCLAMLDITGADVGSIETVG